VSWLREFEAELERRRVRPAVRGSLLAELADHIACEQAEQPQVEATRLGGARETAAQYADELAAEDARRGAFGAFAALACAAGAFVASQVALARVGYPGYNHGYSTLLGLVAIVAVIVGSQTALVCGTLAAWRALRRRGETTMPAAEIELVNRRSRVGLGAGFVTMGGLALYVVDFAGALPSWWLLTSGALVALASGALLFAWRAVARGSGTLVLASGPAGDIYDDIAPLRPLRGHPLGLWALVAIAVGGAVTAFEWHAEHSLAEGLQRGGVEVLALSIGFALLGRAIGARR
jgi:hypothetical protein